MTSTSVRFPCRSTYSWGLNSYRDIKLKKLPVSTTNKNYLLRRVTKQWGGWGYVVCFPTGTTILLFFEASKPTLTQQASHAVEEDGSFHAEKTAGSWSWSPASRAEVRNEHSYTSPLPCVVLASWRALRQTTPTSNISQQRRLFLASQQLHFLRK